MKSVLTVKENDIIARAMGNPQLTNCYLSYADLAKKIETNEISCFRHGSILVLLHMMEGFYKFYYFMETPDVQDPATFAGDTGSSGEISCPCRRNSNQDTG